MFKDNKYYIEKTKYYLGMIATVILFDAVVVMCILFA